MKWGPSSNEFQNSFMLVFSYSCRMIYHCQIAQAICRGSKICSRLNLDSIYVASSDLRIVNNFRNNERLCHCGCSIDRVDSIHIDKNESKCEVFCCRSSCFAWLGVGGGVV